jgi:Rrf2 family protein
MKLTTRGNYAISAVLYIAANSQKSPISLREISTRLDISENYLRQLCMQLIRHGILRSVRGVAGGYYINQNLSQLTLLDIVEVVEGDIMVVDCLKVEGKATCKRTVHCKTKPVWELLNKSIRNCLSELTMEQLLLTYKNDFKK